MIKYTCHKVSISKKNKINSKILVNENFDNISNNIFATKCPSTYHKIGDICCPVFLEDGKCPAPNSIDKTHYNGMPICALNYIAAAQWTIDNNSNKVLRLCSSLPKTNPPKKREPLNTICPSNTEKINGKCYNECPLGFVSNGTKCVPTEFERDGINVICPKNSEPISKSIITDETKCFEKCAYGYTAFNNYCVPNNLANY